MKNLTLILLIIFSIGCGINKPEPAKAKELVEKLLADLKAGSYQNLNQYYTDEFNESESLDKKTDKYKKMAEALGTISSYEFVNSQENNKIENLPALNLTYKVKYANALLTFTFTVIKDEGNYKITFQNMDSNPHNK